MGWAMKTSRARIHLRGRRAVRAVRVAEKACRWCNTASLQHPYLVVFEGYLLPRALAAHAEQLLEDGVDGVGA